ncbi:GPO family capsid scaffolding protein [Vibrio algicola]|uniref:Capsid protein n=1 Tax=Vibrio algicola TaxID=2662262 RepID=A0A5Q0TCA0_9VIBR|nr:GPO family capsid scaffolding protein [Vibrio algicola]
MPKTSDWKIVATEGATVDGRAITANWIKDMADSYSVDEYAALIWPEHYRSAWSIFEGKNWGTVEELKQAKQGGKLRLFAKITPNQYLLDANADGQKLFTSIEPNPDYKGQGQCYLMGLAVTDSPASSGTTRLKFSKDSEHEYSELESLDLTEYFTVDQNGLAKAFSTLANFFKTGGELPQPNAHANQSQEEIKVNEEQLKAIFAEQFKTLKTELKDELKQEFATQAPAPVVEEAPQQFTAADLSAELEKQLKPLNDQVTELKDKFAKLEEEAPGQRPNNTGGGEDNKYSLI